MSELIDALDSDVRLRLDPTVTPVVASADKVHLRAGPWAGPIITLEDESRSGTLAPIVEQFDSGASIADIRETVDGTEEEAVRQIAAELDSKNLLRRADEGTEQDRSPLPLRFSADDLQVLASKSVLVVSSGDIGPSVVAKLSRAGVGEVRVLHRREEGTEREFSSADAVEAWDEREQSVADAVESADVVVAATQQPWAAAAERANELALDSGTPFTHAEVTGYDVVVGPTVLPGETACYECYRHRRNNNIGAPGEYPGFERTAVGREGVVSDYLPLSDIAAGFLVVDVVNLLCYGHGYTVGSVLTVDAATLSVESNDVLRVPRCDACSDVVDDIGRDSLFSPDDLVKQ